MGKVGNKIAAVFLLLAVCVSGCKGEEKQSGLKENTGKEEPGTVTAGAEGTPGAVTELFSGTEAGMLEKQVQQGKLPELAKRLPAAGSVAQMTEVNGLYAQSVSLAAVNANTVTGALFSEGLFEVTEAGRIVPNIAKGYTVDAGATVYTISLREGMRWSDGVPFTADDCVFYYDSLCVPKVTGEEVPGCFVAAAGRAAVKKIDTYTFTVTFPSAKPDFLEQLVSAGGICFAPEHFYVNLLPEYMGEDAALAKAKDMGYETVTQMLRGTLLRPWNVAGLPTLNAFVLSTEDEKNDITGAYYEFVRNPYYWKTDTLGRQLPYLDKVEFTRISGDAQGLLLTTEGYLSVYELKAEQVAEASASAERGGYRIITWTGGRTFAVDDALKNFPENVSGAEQVREIGAAHVEFWYTK